MEEDIRKEYVMLFNGISKTIEEMEGMIDRLKQLQQEAETCVMERDGTGSLQSLPVRLPGEKAIHFLPRRSV